MISSLNEDSRILAMSRSVEQHTLLYACFADTLGSITQRHLGEGPERPSRCTGRDRQRGD